MRRLMILIAAIALSGCTPTEDPVNPDCEVCSPPSPELAALGGRAFLLAAVTFSQVVGVEQISPGLDLDGFDSERGDGRGDCEAQFRDYTASYDRRLSGIDNAGQALIPTGEDLLEGRTFQSELDAAIADGRIRWAIGVGEPIADGSFSTVPLSFYAVEEDEVIVTTEGRPTAGQTLRARVIATLDASVAGSTAFGITTTPVAGLGGGDVHLLPLDDLELGGIAIVGGYESDTLIGAIGGSFTVDALVFATARAVMVSADEVEGARLIFREIADLQPSAADPGVCERVSVGFGFDAVPVTLAL